MNHKIRAKDLLKKMNLEEKIAQLSALWLTISPDGTYKLRDSGDGFFGSEKMTSEVALSHGIGQITRPLGTHRIDAIDGVRGINAIQKYLVEKTRLGIPALPHEEALPGVMAMGATQFPSAINYGSSWDTNLMEKVAASIGDELYCLASRQALSPVLDVARDARWGRTDETFGEDPYLVGAMGVAFVRGLQSKNRRILATLKHFVGHSFSEGGRNHAPVRIGPNEMNDTFLLPFEMAVKLADAGSVMPAYHDVDGEPASSSRYYITKILREKWGFDGIVVSDYGAVDLLMNHHRVARDKAEASTLAIKAGMDLELPGISFFVDGIPDALARGILDMADVDNAVSRILIEKSRLGLFEHPYTDVDAIVLNSTGSRELASEMARKSITLLENNGVLPLSDAGRIAVIGPCADDQLALFCGYSFPVHLLSFEKGEQKGVAFAQTVLDALRNQVKVAEIVYAKGCDILTGRPDKPPVFPGEAIDSMEQKTMVSHDRSKIADAVSVARNSDIVVLVLGDLSGLFLSGTVGEGSDVSSLRLPGVQEDLYHAVAKTGVPVVVVLLNGRPYELGSIRETASAIVEAWLPGQEGAAGIAAVLFGEQNPAGRLTVSFPKTVGSMPYFYNHKFKSPGTPIQPEFGAVYPFGHGLSYSEFTYSNFSVHEEKVDTIGTIVVSGVVTNVSNVDGDEVVQLYIRDEYASVVRPVLELKGFCRVSLPAGTKKRVSFNLPVDMLSFTVNGTDRIVEPGDVRVLIGRSSEDIRFQATVQIVGAVRILGKEWRMLCETTSFNADRGEG
jgi:beta-xylosidase